MSKKVKSKRFLKAKKIGVLGLSIFFLFSEGVNTVKASWLDDWYNNVMTTSRGPDYFKGQKKGYLTFGSFSARVPVQNDYLFSIEKPRFRVGCGGIDLFWGALGFLNFDYLVQKIQLMMQAAPFIAFDVALQTLWPEGSEILKKAEALINALNQIQVSECGIYVPKSVISSAKDLGSQISKVARVATGAEDNPNANPQNSFSVDKLWHNLWQKFYASNQQGYYFGIDADKFVAGLPVDIKGWLLYGRDKGLIEYLMRGTADEQVYQIFRAYVGDIKASTDNGTYKIKYVPGCKDAHAKDIIQSGTIYLKIGNTCTKEESNRFFSKVRGKLMDSFDTLRSKGRLDPDTEVLIKYSPLPLYNLIKYAVMTDQKDLLAQISDPVAKGLIYAALLDLTKNLKGIIGQALIELEKPSDSNSTAGHELKPVIEENVKEYLKQELKEFEDNILALYSNIQKELGNSINTAVMLLKFQELVNRNLRVNVNLSALSGKR